MCYGDCWIANDSHLKTLSLFSSLQRLQYRSHAHTHTHKVPKSKWSKGYLLSSSPDIKTSNEKKKSSNLQEEIRRVRQKQQEIAAERAKEAEINRKEKKAKERDRKNHIAKEKESDMFGNRLGDGATPSTSSSSRATTSSGARSNGRNSTTQPLRSSNTPSYRYVTGRTQSLVDNNIMYRIRWYESNSLMKLLSFHSILVLRCPLYCIAVTKTDQQDELQIEEEREASEDLKSNYFIPSLTWRSSDRFWVFAQNDSAKKTKVSYQQIIMLLSSLDSFSSICMLWLWMTR